MKVALLSDIHGNGAALDAVLASADAAGAERILVAGDLIGYYYEPAHVVRRVRERASIVVRGNHEDMFALWLSGEPGIRDRLHARYGSGLRVAAEQLSPDEVVWLAQLPHPVHAEIGTSRVLVCHGTPAALDDYVYPDADATQRRKIFTGDADVTVFGHTHYPVVWREDGRLAINPGSVGQQRHGLPGASWALWDTDSGEVALKSEEYDRTSLAAQCAEIDPHLPLLASVLERRRSS